MKLLLYVDEYCYKYNGHYYLEEFGQVLLSRYLEVFEYIKLPIRVKNVNSKDELGAFNTLIDNARIEILEIPYGHGLKDYLNNFFSIQRALKGVTHNVDVAILRLPSIYSFNVWKSVINANLSYATEIVFDCYDGYKSASTLIDKCAWYFMHMLQKIACSKALGVSCVTKDYLQKRYYPHDPNAITTHYSSIELPESFYYKERDFPANTPIKIIHVAYQVMYNSRKGHNQLIEALNIIRKKGFDAEILFVGGNYDHGFERLTEYATRLGVDSHIKFTGFLTRKEIRELMLQSSIAILPTKAEGLPRVIIEAMSTGLPCISTNVSGNPELLEMQYLLDYSDVNGLAYSIMHLLNNPHEYERVSQRNFMLSKQFESKTLQKKRRSFYKSVKAAILNLNAY